MLYHKRYYIYIILQQFNNKDMKELIDNLLNAHGLDQYETASNACLGFFESATDAQKELIRKAVKKKAKLINAESTQTMTKISKAIKEFKKKGVDMEVSGRKYPFDENVTQTLNDDRKLLSASLLMLKNTH